MASFSIIIPCLNCAEVLEATLASVAEQTFPDFEAIILAGPSRDATTAVAQRFAESDRRFRVVETRYPSANHVRNSGFIHHARGRFIAFVDVGDLWVRDKLALVLAKMDRPGGPAVLYGRVIAFRDDPARVLMKSRCARHDLRLEDLLAGDPVQTSSNMVISRSWFESSGGFDTALLYGGLLDWLIRLVGAGARIEAINHVLVYQRVCRVGDAFEIETTRKGWDMAIEKAMAFDVTPHHRRLRVLAAAYLCHLADRALALQVGHGAALSLITEAVGLHPQALMSCPACGLKLAASALLDRLAGPRMRRLAR